MQCNIKGFFNNMSELKLLIKEQNPAALISLQATHCQHNFNSYPPNGYTGYFQNSPANTTAKQGIAVLIKTNNPHKIITLNSDLQIIAIEISSNIKCTIISYYFPPLQQIPSKEITDLLASIQTPILFLGDCNSWNPLWGSPTCNKRGKAVEYTINQ